MRALAKNEWVVTGEEWGVIFAHMAVGKHRASIRVEYSEHQYGITHVSSSPGLRFNGKSIHGRYNQWIEALRVTIQNEGFIPQVQQSTHEQAVPPTAPQIAPRPGARPPAVMPPVAAATTTDGPSGTQVRSDAPPGALGFVFGVSAEETSRQCVALGGEPSTDAAGLVISCTNPTEANIGTPVRWASIRLCEGFVCGIDVSVTPDTSDDSTWATTVTQIGQLMVTRYGKPQSEIKKTPPGCPSMYYQCLVDGRVQLDLRWKWSSGHVIQYTAQTIDRAGTIVGQLLVRYFDPAAMKKAAARGL